MHLYMYIYIVIQTHIIRCTYRVNTRRIIKTYIRSHKGSVCAEQMSYNCLKLS